MQSGLYFVASVALCVSALASHAPAHYEHNIRSPVMRSQDAAASVARFEEVETPTGDAKLRAISYFQVFHPCVPTTYYQTPAMETCCKSCQATGSLNTSPGQWANAPPATWKCGEGRKDKFAITCSEPGFKCAAKCRVIYQPKKAKDAAPVANAVPTPTGVCKFKPNGLNTKEIKPACCEACDAAPSGKCSSAIFGPGTAPCEANNMRSYCDRQCSAVPAPTLNDPPQVATGVDNFFPDDF